LSRDTFIIKDPEIAKLLADETRRHILHTLSRHELSASDLAKMFKKNHSSIIHHLNSLLDAGLIEVTKTEKVRNMMVPYYCSVSRSFHVSYSLSEALAGDPDFTAWQEEYLQRMMEGLDAYNIHVPQEQKEKVRDLLRVCYLREKKAYEERIMQRNQPLKHGGRVGRSLAYILSHIQLMKDPEHRAAIEELSQILDQFKEDDLQ
jgi:DNA-binding transcriptional ArsR family regulator